MREPDQEVVGKRTARLLAAELAERASKREFGVVMQDVDSLDSNELLDALAEHMTTADLDLRLALVGESEAVERALKLHKVWKSRLSAEETTAVGWRNKNKRTIAVVACRPLAREASLRSFLRIDERSLYVRLCEEEQKGELPTFLHQLWAALTKLGDVIPLASLVTYAEALHGLPKKDQSLKAAKLLYHLGLLPDEHLADQTSERVIAKRLRANAELLRRRAEITSRFRPVCSKGALRRLAQDVRCPALWLPAMSAKSKTSRGRAASKAQGVSASAG